MTHITITALDGGDAQRLLLDAHPGTHTTRSIKVGNVDIRINVDITAVEKPTAFAEVRLLDRVGMTHLGGTPPTWTYHNPEGYAVGHLVWVPFGSYDDLALAKIVSVGAKGAYTGPGRIKTIDQAVEMPS